MTSVLNNKPASQTFISWHAAETFGELSSFSCCFSSPLHRMSAVTFATEAIIISSSSSRCILTRWLSVCLSTIVFEHWNECPAIKASPCRMIQNKSNGLCRAAASVCCFLKPYFICPRCGFLCLTSHWWVFSIFVRSTKLPNERTKHIIF